MIKYASIIFLTIFSLTIFAQTPTIVRDTSFTLYSAYIKAKQTHPFIRIAQSDMPAGFSTRSVAYCTNNGRSLQLDIFYPSEKPSAPLPGILLIHGGGWRSGDRSQQITMAKKLASSGFVTVTAEYRLSPEAIYPAAVTDLKAAIRWMRANAKEYSIDPLKIAALGCSAGGQLAALLGTNSLKTPDDALCHPGYSSDIQSVVDMDGLLAFIHPESGEGDDSKSLSAATQWFGVPKNKSTTLWDEASALNHVNSKTAPVLFINSAVDRMHAGRGDMIKKLDSLKVYSEVHTFPDAPHPFWFFDPWFEPAMKYTIDFLEKTLK